MTDHAEALNAEDHEETLVENALAFARDAVAPNAARWEADRRFPRETFEQAAKLAPGDPAAHYGAAQAAAVLGKRKAALDHLQGALEIQPAYAAEAAGDARLALLDGDEEFMKLLRSTAEEAAEE